MAENHQVALAHHSHANPDDKAIPGFNHREIFLFLDTVIASAKIGFGQPESNPKTSHTAKGIVLTIPWTFLIFQLIWSGAVVGISYALGDKKLPTLSYEFWDTRLGISVAVTYGVGWALFVLLGFFISEASNRYHEAEKHIGNIGAQLRRVVRCLRQGYPRETWHSGDHERIVSHLIAYPIALKMMLRGEKDPSQLEKLIHHEDLDDIIDSKQMHIQCARVVRAYFSAAENMTAPSSGHVLVPRKNTCGFGNRYFVMAMLDDAEKSAIASMRILNFQSAPAYVNHLRIFLFVWMFFLPLSIVSSSGWFTIPFSVLITYAICMLFTIARALNNPYGFDTHDIKLNVLCAEMSKNVLRDFLDSTLDTKKAIDEHHETPEWLEKPSPKLDYIFHQLASSKGVILPTMPRLAFLKKILKPTPLRPRISVALSAFTVWSLFIVFLTWSLSRDKPRSFGTRWWYVYIPINEDTTAFVSIGLFLLLSFWLSEAYGRYWHALQLWQTNIRPSIEDFAVQLAVCNNKETWHNRDRERLFSYLAAIPHAAIMNLRDSRDVNNLVGILPNKDIQEILAASDPLAHVFNVLYAYINLADFPFDGACDLKESQYYASIHTLSDSLWSVEKGLDQCQFIKKFPISVSFTVHLRLFTAFWLALLPLTLVLHDGFISLFYLIPIAYSIINLLIVGDELYDPFGLDEHDIPLDQFADETRNSIHRIYEQTLDSKAMTHPLVEYDRESFKAKRRKIEDESEKRGEITGTEKVSKNTVMEAAKPKVTAKKLITEFFNQFPHVSIFGMIAITIWTVAAVLASWGLSKLWDDDRNEGLLHGWSSPIQVDNSVIGNMAVFLFLLLAFRAADGITKYDEAAKLIFELKMHLRGLAAQIVQSMEDNSYHEYDKERLIAHLIQIPLRFKDVLLGIERTSKDEKEGLLCSSDREAFEKSTAPLDYLINTVQAYSVLQDFSWTSKQDIVDKSFQHPSAIILLSIRRLTHIRSVIRKAIAVKRFPTVGSYRNHQRIFTAVWLGLLPLSMASQTGFFTIIWVPIIAYGVFGMEEIAERLVDPLGSDAIDVPVDKLCSDASNSILEVVHSLKWGCDYHTKASPKDMEPGLGVVLRGSNVEDRHTLNHLEENTVSVDVSKGEKLLVSGPQHRRIKPSLLAHMLESVPWWNILAVATWSTVACAFSYGTRRRDFDGRVRWWNPIISVNELVGLFVSTGSFAMLGFYGRAAYRRYYSAGTIWAEKLRSACHNLSRGFLSLFPNGAIHEGDHDRIIGHIAAIPLVLKAQLRNSTDLRELQGFLSLEDVGRIQCADSMTAHCSDVLRSYMLKIMCWKKTLDTQEFPRQETCSMMLKEHMQQLEKVVTEAIFLNEFPISPAFIGLLRALLVIWFMILPFVLAEISGWFTILWVSLISYGVLGIYSVSVEIQNPFGSEMNDLDVDELANRIVTDVIDVASVQKDGWKSLIGPKPISETWRLNTPTEQDIDLSTEDENEDSPHSNDQKKDKKLVVQMGGFKRSVQLAVNAVNWWLMLLYFVWSVIAVSFAYLIHRVWPIDSSANLQVACNLWFCSRISISPSIQDYIGFALFLLLGFRLVDSHKRYVASIEVWQERLTAAIRLGTNRLLQSYKASSFHEGDIERIMGFYAAYPICLMGSLQNTDYKEKLLEVLSEEDVNNILLSQERVDYCRDVLWSYMVEAERTGQFDDSKCSVSSIEHRVICFFLQEMQVAAETCQEIQRIPVPYGYVKHLRIFLILYLMLLPLGLVESSGWVTILWTFFIAYGTYGIERWSNALRDPFGHGLCAIPLENLTDSIVGIVKENYSIFKNGANTFIVKDRILTFNNTEKIEVSG